jgi:hypothetical protein
MPLIEECEQSVDDSPLTGDHETGVCTEGLEIQPSSEDVTIVMPESGSSPHETVVLPENSLGAATVCLQEARALETRIVAHKSLPNKANLLDRVRLHLTGVDAVRAWLLRMRKQPRLQATKLQGIREVFQQVQALAASLPPELEQAQQQRLASGALRRLEDIVALLDENDMWSTAYRRSLTVVHTSPGWAQIKFRQDESHEGYRRRSDFFGDEFDTEPFTSAEDGATVTLQPTGNDLAARTAFFWPKPLLTGGNQEAPLAHILRTVESDGKQENIRLLAPAEWQNEFFSNAQEYHEHTVAETREGLLR